MATPIPKAQSHPAVRLLAQTFLYKVSWPKLLGSNLILGVALLISVSVNAVLATRDVPPVYFAVTPDGRLVRLAPLNEPLVSQEKVVQFAQDCISRSFTLTFVDKDLKEHLNSLHGEKGCYTDQGYKALMADPGFSDLISKIRDRHQVSSVVATGAGVVTATAKRGDPIYKWTVQQPISITLVSQTEKRSYSFIIETNIERVPTVDSPDGISTGALRFLGNGQNN
ncbi:DotI/IcmL family type IV secretion protein [Paraburkholderia hospita]|uniref:DotI/IcmL family type IV secretion protein n=1 Tax=Paraburkholderia hospita TaxID=169430 RepID=UPI0008A787FA|nr:DotI/IcmL family type IV secretion protein [Paraburkholderia hospita]SEI14457.1 Macrophage killing protein with similarity to conjugation protein [Paraburkholderia hospita]